MPSQATVDLLQAKPWRRRALQLTVPEADALGAVAEHASLPIDLLARFLQRPLAQTQGLAAGLVLKRCLRHAQLLVDDYPWVWLTARGTGVAGPRYGRTPYPPTPVTLAHRRAIAEVRLHLRDRAPHGTWVGERDVRARRDPADRIPDALFEVDGERHAIEVELSPKSRRSLRSALAENSERYDAVIYFCGARTLGQLSRLKAAEDWPKLIVRPLPDAEDSVRSRRAHRTPNRPPSAEEAALLRVLLEQGAVPLDQLARFLGSASADRTAEAERLAEDLCAANLAVCRRHLATEPAWISPTFGGARLAGSALQPLRYRTGALPRLRALNEVRLHVAERSPEARWVSRRLLLREFGRYAKLPGAVVEHGGERHAIQVALSPASDPKLLVPRIDHLSANHDALLYFCATRRVRRSMESLQERHRWRNLVIRDLPTPA
jgi:hypothetical protein